MARSTGRDRRVVVPFRTTPQKRDWLDKVAEDHNVTRTAVIRAALAIAERSPERLSALLTPPPVQPKRDAA